MRFSEDPLLHGMALFELTSPTATVFPSSAVMFIAHVIMSPLLALTVSDWLTVTQAMNRMSLLKDRRWTPDFWLCWNGGSWRGEHRLILYFNTVSGSRGLSENLKTTKTFK